MGIVKCLKQLWPTCKVTSLWRKRVCFCVITQSPVGRIWICVYQIKLDPKGTNPVTACVLIRDGNCPSLRSLSDSLCGFWLALMCCSHDLLWGQMFVCGGGISPLWCDNCWVCYSQVMDYFFTNSTVLSMILINLSTKMGETHCQQYKCKASVTHTPTHIPMRTHTHMNTKQMCLPHKLNSADRVKRRPHQPFQGVRLLWTEWD